MTFGSSLSYIVLQSAITIARPICHLTDYLPCWDVRDQGYNRLSLIKSSVTLAWFHFTKSVENRIAAGHKVLHPSQMAFHSPVVAWRDESLCSGKTFDSIFTPMREGLDKRKKNLDVHDSSFNKKNLIIYRSATAGSLLAVVSDR